MMKIVYAHAAARQFDGGCHDLAQRDPPEVTMSFKNARDHAGNRDRAHADVKFLGSRSEIGQDRVKIQLVDGSAAGRSLTEKIVDPRLLPILQGQQETAAAELKKTLDMKAKEKENAVNQAVKKALDEAAKAQEEAAKAEAEAAQEQAAPEADVPAPEQDSTDAKQTEEDA